MLEFGTHSDSYPAISFVDRRDMRTRRFDSLIDELPAGRTFVSIDVQGVELAVLRGFGDLINDVDYVYCEVNFQEVYRNCTQFVDLDRFLHDKGFELAVLHDTGQGWGDAFFIRRTGTVKLRWLRRLASRVFPRLDRTRHRLRSLRHRRNRRSPGISASSNYYPQVANCQIPTLSYLLELFLGCRQDGTFVEIGGFDGVFVSNTWGLAERGWHGWIVEPVPRFAAHCRSAHATHPKVTVVEQAIGDRDSDFVRMHVAGALTTANPNHFAELQHVSWARRSLTDDEIVAPATTLDSFLAAHGVPIGFDLLVVDVEGFEQKVFSGFDLAAWRPKMLIVELCDTHPDLRSLAREDAQLGLEITSGGYRIAYKDSMNTVFVRIDVWDSAYSRT